LCKNQEGGGLENNSKYFYNITINKSHGKGLSDRIKKKNKKQGESRDYVIDI
jgi:hypothetical protein